ncbi:MAG: DUF2723 domain-containing protein [Anaerolineae bacterium]|nr:DUF2723 domain-containing protein [Anaerolineae bacterium]
MRVAKIIKKSSNKYITLTVLFLSIIIPIGVYAGILPTRYSIANNGLDGGDLLAALLTGGVAHPSGYPTYLVTAQIFQFLPWASPFFKGALFSFSAAIITLLLTTLLSLKINAPKNGAIAAGFVSAFCLGGSSLFMSQAVIVEVYTFQSCFVMVFLFWFWLSTQPGQAERSKIWLMCILSIICGLSLGNHATGLLLLPLFLGGLYLQIRNQWRLTYPLLFMVLFIAGLSIYLVIPWRASFYPAVNWGNAQSWKNFLWLVGGELYQGLLFNSTPLQLWERLKALSGIILANFGIIGLLFGIFGAFQSDLSKKINWALLYVFITSVLFSAFYASYDSTVYLLPALIVFSIWIGNFILKNWDGVWRKVAWGRLVFFFLLLTGAFLYYQTRQSIDPRREHAAADFAESYLSSVPQGAILLTGADADTFPLWYYHYGLGWRPDVKIITLGLVQYDWYRDNLSHNFADLKISLPNNNLYDDTWIRELSLNNNQTTVCRSWPITDGRYEINTKCY